MKRLPVLSYFLRAVLFLGCGWAPHLTAMAGANAGIEDVSGVEPREVSRAAGFARIFREHAVLQRGCPVPVWGFAEPGEELIVRFAGQSHLTTADSAGRWEVSLNPLKASFEPQALQLFGADGSLIQELSDVLVGEVWVLAGQSNMAWWLQSSDGGEAAAAQADYPWLRVFDPGRQLPDEPATDTAPGAKWTVCTPQTAGSTSAIGFWFAEALHRHFEVPVGLVQTAVSGTYGESWVPREVLEAIPEARPRLGEYQAALGVLPEETKRWEAEKASHEAAVAAAREAGEVPPQPSFFVRHGPMGPNHFHRPYALFNGRIAPVAPFAARGVVWYQGEGNTQKRRAPYYDDILRGLLASWRKAWNSPELPFIFIQLPRFKPGPHNDWPMVREKQFEVAQEDPFTGLVSTIDLGDPDDIHPRDKQPVADRTARMALALVYGLETTAGGPMLQDVERRGEDVLLTFSGTGEGLRLTRGDRPAGFSFETEAGVVIPAKAALDGPERIRLTLPPMETRLIAVRYAAEAVPDVNLINSLGLPAAPFRMPLPPAESPDLGATPRAILP
jgi:hypothetical protein